MIGIRRTATALALAGTVAVGGLSAAPAKAAVIDLAFLLDASGSIPAPSWDLMTDGLSTALGNLSPTIGTTDTYRVTVVGFGTSAYTIVGPTLIDDPAVLAAIQTTVAGASQSAGFTNFGGAIEHTVSLVSGVGGVGDLSYINISTDGTPTVAADGTANETSANIAASKEYAIDARDAAIAAGWDSFSAEAVTAFADVAWLRDDFVYPQPGVLAPPFPNPLDNGFVVEVASFDDYGAAIDAKIRTIVDTQVPEPGSLLLFAVGLLGLGVFIRRRRAVPAS